MTCFGFIYIWKMLSPIMNLSKTPSAALDLCQFSLAGKMPQWTQIPWGKSLGRCFSSPLKGSSWISLQRRAVPYFTGQTSTARFCLELIFIHMPENLMLEEKCWQGSFTFISSSHSVFPQRNIHQVLGSRPCRKLDSLVKFPQLILWAGCSPACLSCGN